MRRTLSYLFFSSCLTLGNALNNNSSNTTETQTQPEECQLNDRAQALVTFYTTIFSATLAILTRPHIEAFMLAWISWLPLFRALAGVVIYLSSMVEHIAIIFAAPDPQEHISLWGGPLMPLRKVSPFDIPLITGNYWQEDVKRVTGIVWWLFHVYFPYSQWSWFVNHIRRANALVFFARATMVGLTLVALSLDYKARAIRTAARRSRRLGIIMCIVSSFSRISLAFLMCANYIVAAVKDHHEHGSKNIAILIPIILIFSFIWAIGSFAFAPGRDAEAEDTEYIREWGSVPWFFKPFYFVVSVVVICMLPFIVWKAARVSDGLDLPEYVKCESISAWRRIQDILF